MQLVHLCFLKGAAGSWDEVMAFGAQNDEAASKAVRTMGKVAGSGMMRDAAGEEAKFLKKMRGSLGGHQCGGAASQQMLGQHVSAGCWSGAQSPWAGIACVPQG